MCQELGDDGQAGVSSPGDCFAQPGGVPVDDDGGEQVEACHAVVLPLRGPIPDFSLASDAQGILQGVVGFSLVQADVGTPLHGRVQRPVDHEEGALDAADFAQRRGEVVTARVGGQLAQDQTRGDRAGGRSPRAAGCRASSTQ